MEPKNFNRIYDSELTPKQKEVIPLFLQGLSNQQIADKLYVQPSTVSKRITSICQKFSALDRDKLIEWFRIYRPELFIADRLLDKVGILQIPYPDGAEEANSPFYLERDVIDIKSKNIIQQPGCLLRIKAPKEMGKTSLLNRLFDCAEENQNHVMYWNLNAVDTNTLSNYGKFLQNFCGFIAEDLCDSLGINFNLPSWTSEHDNHQECSKFLRQVLEKLEQPLVLLLDNLERVFEYQSIYQNFFPLLRHWHEKGKNPRLSRIWKKLKLVIAYSTEDYGKLDINKSPFNVGEVICLGEFSRQEAINLAKKHGIYEETTIDLLRQLIGGHPYLIRLALYNLTTRPNLTIDKLLEEAVTDSGIYQQHLRRHLESLQNNPLLEATFKQVLNGREPIIIREQKLRHQLEGMGLIKIRNNAATVKYKLYQLYFREFSNY